MSFVLDASVVLSWCFPDEQSQKAEIIAERIAQGQRAFVTAFWPHEVLNSLLNGERRKRITPELSQTFIDELESLAPAIDITIAADVFKTIQGLCRKHGLTTYDAAYLELALRNKLPLATVDNDLQKAAKAESVALL